MKFTIKNYTGDTIKCNGIEYASFGQVQIEREVTLSTVATKSEIPFQYVKYTMACSLPPEEEKVLYIVPLDVFEHESKDRFDLITPVDYTGGGANGVIECKGFRITVSLYQKIQYFGDEE